MLCKLSVLFVGILLFGCSAQGTKSKSANRRKADTVVALAQSASSSDGHKHDTEIVVVPAEISNFSSDLTLCKPFDPLAVLKKLYPGNYYALLHFEDDRDSVRLEAWTNHKMTSRSLSGWHGEDPPSFPYEEGNMTSWMDTLLYRDDDGHANIIQSFSTVRAQEPSLMYTGRFECAILGLAWFTEQDGTWRLRSFDPALGCYGAFQYLPKIHLLKFGRNNYGCYLSYSNGGAGGPFYADLYVFGLINNCFTPIMTVADVERHNSGHFEWKMKVGSSAITKGEQYGDIPLSISGSYGVDTTSPDDELAEKAPPEIRTLRSSRDSFKFSVSRIYRFNNGAYKLHSSVLK